MGRTTPQKLLLLDGLLHEEFLLTKPSEGEMSVIVE